MWKSSSSNWILVALDGASAAGEGVTAVAGAAVAGAALAGAVVAGAAAFGRFLRSSGGNPAEAGADGAGAGVAAFALSS